MTLNEDPERLIGLDPLAGEEAGQELPVRRAGKRPLLKQGLDRSLDRIGRAHAGESNHLKGWEDGLSLKSAGPRRFLTHILQKSVVLGQDHGP